MLCTPLDRKYAEIALVSDVSNQIKNCPLTRLKIKESITSMKRSHFFVMKVSTKDLHCKNVQMDSIHSV